MTRAPGCFVGDRERDRAAPGADVEHARLGDPVDPRQAALDDDLRLGSRNEHARVDVQRQPAKSPLAEHVRERLTKLAAGDEAIELLQRRRRPARGGMLALRPLRVVPSTWASRISASTCGGLAAGGCEPVGGTREGGRSRRHTEAAASA